MRLAALVFSLNTGCTVFGAGIGLTVAQSHNARLTSFEAPRPPTAAPPIVDEAACLEDRQALYVEAMGLSDPQDRVVALRALPSCSAPREPEPTAPQRRSTVGWTFGGAVCGAMIDAIIIGAFIVWNTGPDGPTDG
jgi:hypothetical protein